MKVTRDLFERRISEVIANTSWLLLGKILKKHQRQRTLKRPICPVCRQIVRTP